MHIGVLAVSLLYGVILVQSQFQYYFIDLKMSWADAREYCREKYTDLATLVKEEESFKTLPPAWIGMFDVVASWKGVMTSDPNSWRWSSTGTTSPGGFQRWAWSEPDNWNGREHCVFIRNGLWLDYFCTNSLPFICYTVQSGVKHYFLVNTSMTWSSSQTYCREHYHDLATVETSAENQAVKDLLPNTRSSFWIGLYREGWRWSSGDPTTYSAWVPGEPNNYGGGEGCAVLKENNTWNDAPCWIEYNFICHQDVKASAKTKIRVQTTADLSDPAVRDKFLKVLNSRLGVGFRSSWIIPPAKEKIDDVEDVDDDDGCT